ncbi:MAG: Na(+)/H(+) antiporter subunit B [Bacteroidetes bacterium]|jgi:multisubunit Na+/H+ antiporter MnhB subunit|nr:Na(+)/H(+) antiporter subunit B [Bacteroidota bacterium]MBU1579964.1 Na(+)/H(+) antiporter subunit B [Bacteroidota bacterium]MBU2464812.1 Na(+)/H(+) antiporter subunit B [Bacteroidota bacterium]MBU2558015.1 Na(+)/H(+) antiporter subunit B [Bacteroidota bacterium]MDA3942399.1 Na(+)/H(+) antiporter subunit B [Bacteroidota bacterium]
METEILKIAAKHLKPFLLILSLFVFYRGHNEPGGGFIGGLMAGMALVLYAGAFGVEEAKKLRLAKPLFFIGLGFGLALISSLLGLLVGQGGFMTAVWNQWQFAGFSLKLGSPLLFDLGVYFVVAGMLVKVIFSVMEEDV